MDAQSSTGESAAPIEELRRLLLEPEREAIADVKRRIADRRMDTEALSEALPEAVVRAWQSDSRLGKAIAPAVEQALDESIRRNPRALAELLFPIIGPAIRRAIANALHGMQASLNAALEKSVSPRSLRWRLEARRTGRPFGEVVMAHTLQYRVTHVMLIHAGSGLLLGHVAAPDEPEIEPELTSGMLQAILAFARESFGERDEETVNQLRIGDFNLVVESGPRAILAASVQGFPSPALQDAMADALETIHLEHGDRLRAFDGNPEPFATSRPLLQACLMQERAVKPAANMAGASRRKVVFALALLTLMLLPALLFLRMNARWVDYRDRLHAEPGLLVLESERRGLGYFIRGLRDPLARPPDALREASGLSPGRIDEQWEFYASGDPPLVLARAARVLDPPATVRLTVEDGAVVPVGEADHAWIAAARRAESRLPAGAVLDWARTTDRDRALVARLLGGLPRRVSFAHGVTPAPGAEATLRNVAGALSQLGAAATRAGQEVTVELAGTSDPTGTADQNRRLRRRRALWLQDYLTARGVPRDLLAVAPFESNLEADRSVHLTPRVAEAGAP